MTCRRDAAKTSGVGSGTRPDGWHRGRSSVVERQLPKLNVVGSIPIARSKNLLIVIACVTEAASGGGLAGV